MILTPLALALLLIPALLLYATAWVPLSADWAMLAALAIVALIVLDNRRSRRRVSLEVQRDLDEKLSLGADNPVRLTVRSRSAAGALLQIKDDPPVAFSTPQRLHHLRLQPWEQATLTYHTRPTNRGRYSFGNLHVRGRSALGLSYWQRSFPAAQEVAVYPNLLEVSRYQYLARTDRLRQAGFRIVHRRGEGTEFESLRDHTPDDEYRSIDWKATARRHRPTSRQYEIERSQTVIIMIDAGRMMTAQIGDLSRLDYAINAALMLSYVASEKDDAVGLITFAEEVKGFVPPRKGRGQVGRITEALYDLQPALVEPDYAAAFGMLYGRARKRALVVCFTDLVDVDASRRLLGHLAALAPHHLPLLITLRDSTLEQAARQTPEDSFGVYQKAMAAEVLADREVALGVLRQRGVLVLDAAPEKLTVSAVNEYLNLKARGKL
ncbi:MAG: DUF58 domain-containing protein [Armatimonadota bacterium]